MTLAAAIADTMQTVAAETIAARERTGRFIGTRVKAGKIQVVELTRRGSTADAEPLSDWLANTADAVKALRAL